MDLLKILQIESELVMGFVNSERQIKQEMELQQEIKQEIEQEIEPENTDTENKPKQLDFNPYAGIGDNNINYTIEEMYASLANCEDTSSNSGPSIETLIKITGIHKMINMDELSNKLRNMNEEDVHLITNNLKQMMGDHVDDKTSNFIGNMMMNVSKELQQSDKNTGDALTDILKTSYTVAENMHQQAETENIDLQQISKSARAIMNNCKDANGNAMFAGSMNPLNMLDQLTKDAQSGTINKDQYMKQCMSMMSQSMGMAQGNGNVIPKPSEKKIKKQNRKMKNNGKRGN